MTAAERLAPQPTRGPSRTAPLIVFALALAALPIVLPNSYYTDVAVRVAINATVAIALNLLIGYTGQISLGHAAFFGLGAYGSAILASRFDWPPVTALAGSAAAIGVFAYGLARIILRLEGHYLAMATLGVGVIATIALTNETGLTGGPDGMSAPEFIVFGFTISGERQWYWVFMTILVAALWLAANLVDSPAGRALRALRGSETAARTLGVNAASFKARVFTLSAIATAAMGSLYGDYVGFITPSLAAFPKSIELVTMVVVGGMASIWGSLVGAALLSLLPELLARYEGSETIVFGLILLVTMILMPRGIVPTLGAALVRRSR